MASVAPPRRFKVEPIETTTSSSKERKEASEGGTSRPLIRKFAPEPVETTTKSNRRFAPQPVETTERTNRKFAPEPIETTTKSNRKFAPELTETTTRSNRKFAPEPTETTQRTNRRFAPEPVETTQSTNRKSAPQPLETTQKKVRRFAPEPVEITSSSSKSSRRKFTEEWDEKTSPRRFKPEPLETTARGNKKQPPSPRKFAPQLVESAQRTRKAGDATPALLPSDKTEATPEISAISARRARILGISPTPPNNTPTIDLSQNPLSQNPLFLEIQRSELPPSRRRSWFSCSQHSFRVPDLDPIESSESEGSNPPSPITSNSDHSFMYKEATRRRESVDDSSSGYMLALAAKAAERQLREQAMAAFPNDDFHEPVDHFIDHETDDGDTTDRRGSSYSEVNWDLKAMREYQDLQDYEKRKLQRQAAQPTKAVEATKPAFNPFGNPAGFLDAATAKKMAQDNEVEPMRKSARPPMLGKNIKFPRCASPEPARFDPTQGCDAVRTAMCYLSEQSKAAEDGKESLWCGKGNGKQTSTTPSLWSTANSRASSTHGLWGGMCTKEGGGGGDKSPRGPTGILTPRHEKENPLSPNPSPATSMSLLPPTPPAYSTDFGNIDEKLAIEQTIEEEFGDDFVTQVYNYLSLGYPSMAQPFDPELSKISGIPISELRQDDHLAKSRGYIRLGKDGNLKDVEITEETCTRWRALRTYIQEWARQHPKMSEQPSIEGHGVAVRKGSWGL